MIAYYLRRLIPFGGGNGGNNEEKKEDNHIPDTIIQVDPNDMTIDLETGHLILVTHLEKCEPTEIRSQYVPITTNKDNIIEFV